MPTILEPTLIQASGTLSANAAGATEEQDFDFGNLEGALLLGVEYGGSLADGTTGIIEMGLNFDAGAAAPAASLDLAASERVFAYRAMNVIAVTAASVFFANYPWVNLEPLKIFIASNIAVQTFNTGAVARTLRSKIYFKRVLFTQAEMGGRLAIRR